ncbi:hypothetical protein ACLB2K_071821 [Fragaria x ananassa]
MLRACVMDFKRCWEDHLQLIEFAYNNSYHSSIDMAPYEALYGRPCRYPICLAEVGDSELLGPDIVQETTEKVSLAKGVVRFGKNGKLAPRYVGPFEILERVGDFAYRLALPPVMSGVHNVFHVSLLRMYVPDASHVVDYGTIKVNADATFVVEPVRILNRSTKRLLRKEVDLVKVCWTHHDEGDASWDLESDMRTKYPRLFLD